MLLKCKIYIIRYAPDCLHYTTPTLFYCLGFNIIIDLVIPKQCLISIPHQYALVQVFWYGNSIFSFERGL